MPTYNAILEDIRSRGFDLVPNNPDYWQEDWCCFRIVPLTAKADAQLPPKLRVSLYSASHAARVLRGFPILDEAFLHQDSLRRIEECIAA